LVLFCISDYEIKKVLLTVKEQRNILHEISKRNANWIGHILCRNCLLQQVVEGKIKGGIEVTGRRGRRRRKLLNGPKERRGYSHLKEEALDRTVWGAGFGRGFGPDVRQTAKWIMSYSRCDINSSQHLPRIFLISLSTEALLGVYPISLLIFFFCAIIFCCINKFIPLSRICKFFFCQFFAIP
jgi:hypothetical protein